ERSSGTLPKFSTVLEQSAHSGKSNPQCLLLLISLSPSLSLLFPVSQINNKSNQQTVCCNASHVQKAWCHCTSNLPHNRYQHWPPVRTVSEFVALACTSVVPSVKILKFADSVTVIGLIQDNDKSAYRWTVDQVVPWNNQNNQELNTAKTVEMTVDFRRSPPAHPALAIRDRTVMAVESHKFLGTTLTKDLKWDCNTSSIIKKVQQRMYFLRQLRFILSQELAVQFYTATIESVSTTSITVCGSSATKYDTHRQQCLIRSAEKTTGVKLPTLLDLNTSRTRKRAEKIITDPSHPGHPVP
ncbi:hypothetical protein NFI96_011922, partial [Prochilodus magdalenae]